MAPAKKKKKAAANPARGFATTSTVSKARIEQEQPEQPQIEEIGAMTGPVPNTSVSTTAKVGVEQVRELSELTPEELETQLEESELQILVETHGDKSRRDSSRQISRLQTERRLLRSQALPLITSHWLPSEVVQIILDQIQSDAKTQTALAADTSQGCPSDELCIRIWTLRRVLEELGFLCERVKEAIQHLLENQNTLYRPEASTSKESLWGLDDCIQWLALHCSVEELPDYESHKTEVLERLLRDSSLTELPPVTPSTSGMATPDESVSSKVANGPAEKTCQPEQETLPAEAFSDDDDLMPHEFMDRYIGLKRRVHAERPDLTEVRNPGRRKQKPKPKLIREAKEEEVIPIHPKIARLQRRIRKIESDILFDKEGALEMWAAIRLGLVKEAAIRQRTLNENSKEDREENKNGDDVPLERPSSGATSVDEDDGDVGVGDFFSSLPEESQSSTPGTKTMTIAAADGTSIISRDFGKWSGLSPRRVLEEACRAR
jgi:ATP-dependent RNA helicase DHX29